MSSKTRGNEKRTAVEYLSFDARTSKRVTWESWEFTVVAPFQVEVTNASYGYLKEEHAYIVEVEDRDGLVVPAECECPADVHWEPDCKHKVALATVGGPTVLDAAANFEEPSPETRGALTADGGLPAEDELDVECCPNGDPDCGGPNGDELPCFPCFYREEGDWRPTVE